MSIVKNAIILRVIEVGTALTRRLLIQTLYSNGMTGGLFNGNVQK